MFKVKIQRTIYGSVQLFLLNYHADGRVYYNLQKEDGLWQESTTEGGKIEPFLELYGRVADEFMQSLAEELDRNNIKTDKDAKIQGTLEATRYHLEDLRNLLKLKR